MSLYRLSYRLDYPALMGKNFRCNFHCPYCHHDYFLIKKDFIDANPISFVDSIKLLENIFQDSTLKRKIHVSGRAEPLIIDKKLLFDTTYKLKKSFNWPMTITTNGTNLKDYARDLKSSGFDKVNLSLHKIDSIKNINFNKMIEKTIKNELIVSLNIILSTSVLQIADSLFIWANSNNVNLKFFESLPPNDNQNSYIEKMLMVINSLNTSDIRTSNHRVVARYNNVIISLKLSEKYSIRPHMCSKCLYRDLCLEGCWGSIRITPWYIKPCGVKDENVYFFDENSVDKLKYKLHVGGKY